MQDAVLIYYMMANLLHAGYFADIAKMVQQAVTQLRVTVAVAGCGTRGQPAFEPDLRQPPSCRRHAASSKIG